MTIGSTVGRNVKNVICKYDVPTMMCRVTYADNAAVMKNITKIMSALVINPTII